MNEFDKNPIDHQPAPDHQPDDAPEMRTNDDLISRTSPDNSANSYAYKGDQLADATTRVNRSAPEWYGNYSSYGSGPSTVGNDGDQNGHFAGNKDSSAQNANAFAAEQSANSAQSGEYEVSFDSASGKYTYTDRSANPTPAQPPRQNKSGRVLLALGLCATILVSTLLGVGGGALAGAYFANRTGNTNGNLNSDIQQATVIQVNNGEVNYGAISEAAAKCYDSVVVIETYLSETYAEAGEASGAGSGVIWTADGYIVTCNHVIDGANVIRVILTDGSTYYADVVGTDAQTDLAVLKVQASGLRAVTARGTALVLGESSIAIGNPLGVLANTVSEGILSCLAREITVEGQSMSLLQTTAAVNSGNSGGGLFDINGSLIGIVNAKSTGDSVEGLGFAIPIETVIDISTQIIEQGFVSGRPQLGVSVITITQSNANSIFADPEYSALQEYATKTERDGWGREYTRVVPGTYLLDASAVVGYADGSDSLKFGDMILYVGNTEVETTADVKAALSGYGAGDTIQLTVLREQRQTIIINLILGQLGDS